MKNKLEIPLARLVKNKLSVEDYVILYLLNEKNIKDLGTYLTNCSKLPREKIDNLILNNYLCKTSEEFKLSSLKLTDKALDYFKSVNVDWIKEWYELFPRGIISGGYPVKTDPSNCKVRMERFIKKYPNYSKDIIMKATHLYLEEMQNQRYQMCKLAPYFIEKDGLSTLQGYCEKVLEGDVVKTSYNKNI